MAKMKLSFPKETTHKPRKTFDARGVKRSKKVVHHSMKGTHLKPMHHLNSIKIK